MRISIRPVETRSELRAFVRLPQVLYRSSYYWVPPLWADESRGYNASTNPVLRNSDYALFLACTTDAAPAGGYALGRETVVGRVLVYVDRTWNEFYKTSDGLFGALDAVADQHVFKALLEAGNEWLRAAGAKTMIGPINPVAEYWGTLVEGFEATPMFLTPWHPPGVDELMTGAGFERQIDLYAYEADSAKGYVLPDRYERFYHRFFQRNPDYTIRRLSMRHFMRDAEAIWRISNDGLTGNWGYVPVPKDVYLDMVKRLKVIVDPEAVWFVEHRGRAVAFALGFPDANLIFKKIDGKLFPFGWLRLLRERRKLRDYRLFGLAAEPPYQGLGLDALMYVHLYKHLAPRGIRLEANWILDNNDRMNNALVKLGLNRTKRYRIYRRCTNFR